MPVEILQNVLRHLSVVSLKSARLTCKYWAALGARCLFRRVYFAPRQDVIDVFLEITGNAAFASNIEEMVYDARLFWSHLEDPHAYADWPSRIEWHGCYHHGDIYYHVLGDAEDEPAHATVTDTNRKRYDTGEAFQLTLMSYSSLVC